MRLCNCNISRLNDNNGRRIICFGVSSRIKKLLIKDELVWAKNVKYFIDNNADIQETSITLGKYKFCVYSPDILFCESDITVLITSFSPLGISEIIEQLYQMNISSEIRCFSLYMMEQLSTIHYDNSVLDGIKAISNLKIEKKIHSCWFSQEKKPKKYQECIDSWKRLCPDYEFVEWNSGNYDFEVNKYVRQAYEQRAWAYVSDFARLEAVYKYGGIYLDMDVELLRSLDDLLKCGAFFSFDFGKMIDLGSGFGAVKGHPLVKKLMDKYENIDFITDKKYSSENVIPQPLLLIDVFREHGFQMINSAQIIGDVVYYTPDYFGVINDYTHDKIHIKGTEYAIHWHHAGWYEEEKIKKLESVEERRNYLMHLNWEEEDI